MSKSRAVLEMCAHVLCPFPGTKLHTPIGPIGLVHERSRVHVRAHAYAAFNLPCKTVVPKFPQKLTWKRSVQFALFFLKSLFRLEYCRCTKTTDDTEFTLICTMMSAAISLHKKRDIFKVKFLANTPILLNSIPSVFEIMYFNLLVLKETIFFLKFCLLLLWKKYTLSIFSVDNFPEFFIWLSHSIFFIYLLLLFIYLCIHFYGHTASLLQHKTNVKCKVSKRQNWSH